MCIAPGTPARAGSRAYEMKLMLPAARSSDTGSRVDELSAPRPDRGSPGPKGRGVGSLTSPHAMRVCRYAGAPAHFGRDAAPRAPRCVRLRQPLRLEATPRHAPVPPRRPCAQHAEAQSRAVLRDLVHTPTQGLAPPRFHPPLCLCLPLLSAPTAVPSRTHGAGGGVCRTHTPAHCRFSPRAGIGARARPRRTPSEVEQAARSIARDPGPQDCPPSRRHPATLLLLRLSSRARAKPQPCRPSRPAPSFGPRAPAGCARGRDRAVESGCNHCLQACAGAPGAVMLDQASVEA